MGTQALDEQARSLQLRQAYVEAFQQYSVEARLLHSLVSHLTPDGEAVEAAGRRVEQAQSVYRRSRDLLADFMLSREMSESARRTPGSCCARAAV